MQDERYLSLGELAGAEVGVHHVCNGQDILIQHCDVGQRLARLLDPDGVQTVQQAGTTYLCVPHTHPVDALLMELIDLFISIRYAH